MTAALVRDEVLDPGRGGRRAALLRAYRYDAAAVVGAHPAAAGTGRARPGPCRQPDSGKVCVTAVDSRPSAGPRPIRPGAAPSGGRRGWREVLAAYVALTKPRIIELLLVTTVPTMFLAAGGVPSLWLVAGDPGRRLARRGQRQHPQLLPRPRHRRGHAPHRAPAAGHRRGLAAGRRWCSGSCSGVASVAWLALLVNAGRRRWPRSRSRSTSSSTRCCSSGGRRRTSSGAAPPAACPCSSAGRPSPGRWPGRRSCCSASSSSGPRRTTGRCRCGSRDDYAAAGVPMLPVVAPARGRGRQIVAYAWAMVACSLVLVPVAHMTAVYAVAALVLGAGFLVEAYAAAAPGCARARTSGRCGCSTGRSRT